VPSVNTSELGSADNVIPIGGRCISKSSMKKKYAAHAREETSGKGERERERLDASEKKAASLEVDRYREIALV